MHVKYLKKLLGVGDTLNCSCLKNQVICGHSLEHLYFTSWNIYISHPGILTFHTLEHLHFTPWDTYTSHPGALTFHILEHLHVILWNTYVLERIKYNSQKNSRH